MEGNWPINLTLFIQIPIFMAFVWIMMSVIWPPLIKAFEQRQIKIAEGLAAVERGHNELVDARKKAMAEIAEAKERATLIITEAQQQALLLKDETKSKVTAEIQARTEEFNRQLTQVVNQAESRLKVTVEELSHACAQKILQTNQQKTEQ